LSCARVVFLGTGAARHPVRSTSSLLVDYGGGLVLVDAGCGALRVMGALGYDPGDVEAILVTHAHADHVCGVPMVLFAATYSRGPVQVTIAAPRGAEDAVAGLASSVRGAAPIEARVLAVSPGWSGLVGAHVEAGHADHGVPALSYALDLGGARVVVSGDTRPTAWFASVAEGAALAVHEATYPSGMEGKARERGHSTVGEAVAQVEGAEVPALYHLTGESEVEAARAGRVMVPGDGTVVKVC